MHARNIALYASGTTNFDTQGLGILRDALTCESTETAATNGNITYTLELTYPIGGYLADQLTNGNLIRAQVGSSSDDYMIFEIVNNVKADSGTITVYADAYPYRILRMSFDNGGIFGKYSSVQDALTALKSKITDFPSDFQLISGIGTSIDLTQASSTSSSSSATVADQQPTSWTTFGDALNEIMNQVSGQVEYGVNYIRIYSVRGADVNATMLRDDKNTNGISIKTDTENIVNRIIPMIPVIGSDGNATGAYKVGTIVTSSVAHNWINFWSAKVVQVTDQNYANNYFNITSCDRPTLTATVTTSMLDQDLSDVHLFDRLTVYSKRINYAAKLQISTRVFDNLTGEVSSFSLGSSAVTVFTQQQTTVNQIASLLQDTQYAIASANGKNTNYYGGTNEPTNAKEGDTWFVKIDGVSYIKQYHAGNWEIIVNDATQDQIKQTVAQAVANGQDALNKANDAVSTANSANSSVQSAISAAQDASDKANNANTAANNAISQATSASTVANNVSQEIVTLKGGSTATLAELENGLALKLSTSDFNTQMANYATQTWTTNQITATSDSLSSTISRVQTQVNNSAVGTNLLTGTSGTTNTTISGTGWYVYSSGTLSQQLQPNTTYTYSVYMVSASYTWYLEVQEYDSNGNIINNLGNYPNDTSTGEQSITFTTSSNSVTFKPHIVLKNPSTTQTLVWNSEKLEKGDRVTDWSANPADNATVTSVSNVTQKVDSLSTVVSGKVDTTTYTSKVTELANAIATKVESDTYNSKMTQLDNAISAKVSSSDYTSQVNILTNQINSKVSQTDWANSAVGANLLTGTSGALQTVPNVSGWNTNAPSCSSIVATIDSDTSYTARAWISPVSYDMQIQVVWKDTSGNPHYDGGNTISANTSGYSTWTGVITAGGTIQYVTIVFTASQSIDSSVSYKEMKLEKGSYATPWCPAASEIANYSQITQLSNKINLRVVKNDVINQINLSDEEILIDGERIRITGQTIINDAVIKSAMIDSVSADKITAGTIDADTINLINLNANNMTTGTLSGSNLSLNLNTGEVLFQKGSIKSSSGTIDLEISNGTLSVTNSIGNGAFFSDGKIYMSDKGGLAKIMSGDYSSKQYGVIEQGAGYVGISNGGIAIHGANDGFAIMQDASTTTQAKLSPDLAYFGSVYDGSGLAISGKHVYLGGDTDSKVILNGGTTIGGNGTWRAMQPHIIVGQSSGNVHSGGSGNGNQILMFAQNINLNEAWINNAGDTWYSGSGDWWFRKANNSMSTIHVQSVSQASLLSLKTNLKKLDPAQALSALISTDICSYNYKSDLQDGVSKTYATPVIDDVNDTPQYSIPYDFISADGTGRDDGTILGYAVEAIKELNSKIASLETEIKTLKGE